jgi:RNA polymerase sigma factor (sigma-70 family)
MGLALFLANVPMTLWSKMIYPAMAGDRQACAALCQGYWRPVYWALRRGGKLPHDEAEEVTQEVMAEVLSKRGLRKFKRTGARFRSWMCILTVNRLREHFKRKKRPQKAGVTLVQIDIASADIAEHEAPLRDDQVPSVDEVFDYHWARTVAARAYDRVRKEYTEREDFKDFAHLDALLSGLDDGIDDRTIAEETGQSAIAVRVGRHNLKEELIDRCKEYLRDEILKTVSDPSVAEDELRVVGRVLWQRTSRKSKRASS